MAKTIEPSGKMDRNEYLRKLAEARYGQQSGTKSYGISSPSKVSKRGNSRGR